MSTVEQYLNDLEDSRELVEQVEKFITNFNLITQLYENNGCTFKQLEGLLDTQIENIDTFIEENKSKLSKYKKINNRVIRLQGQIIHYDATAFLANQND